MDANKPVPTALSTERPSNRFDTHIYFRVSPEGMLIPLERRKRKAAQYVFTLTIEYPAYEEELKMKLDCTRYDENHHIHYTDYDLVTEARVRKCLVRWDLHEKLPGFTIRLHRIQRQLEDESMDAWKRLPPLVRKTVGAAINEALGPA
jgi:hypothetical protein